MQRLGFTVSSLFVIALLVAGGFFALRALRDPALYVPKDSEKIGDLHPIATDPETGTTNAAAALASAAAASAATSAASAVAPDPQAPSASGSVSDSGDLESGLTALATSKKTLKAGSKGSDVVLIQQFMNLYFKKTSKTDGIFGKTLTANVQTFQKQNKISQTGQIGPTTIAKMIQWLHNNPQ